MDDKESIESQGALLSDPAAFWRTAESVANLLPPAGPQQPPALEKLGPSPFPKSRFPFLGFLATVYDHVASRAAAITGNDADAAGAPTDNPR